MNNVRELLPIGSVVMLKEASKKAMIYGIKQINNETDEEFDYMGVVYPEGNLGDGTQFFFNHDMIDKVFFRGYEDDERADFIQRLAEFYDRNENS